MATPILGLNTRINARAEAIIAIAIGRRGATTAARTWLAGLN
ncbi:MAG: hypothetical protein WD397_04280 [Wenzhouxiangellaceae bacterium]